MLFRMASVRFVCAVDLCSPELKARIIFPPNTEVILVYIWAGRNLPPFRILIVIGNWGIGNLLLFLFGAFALLGLHSQLTVAWFRIT